MEKTSRDFCTIEIKPDGKYYIRCIPVWPNIEVQWRRGYSIQLHNTPKDKRLAEQFKKAVEAGKIYKNPRVVKTEPENPNDKPRTYVKWDGYISPRRFNAELKRLGY